MTGFVYAMVSGDTVKIGFSEKPHLRVNKVRSDTPCDVRLIGFVEATRDLEIEAQKMLEPWRVFGEWFRLEARAVAAFVEALRGRGMSRSVMPGVMEHALRTYRRKAGLTLDEVGAALGRTKGTLSKMETELRSHLATLGAAFAAETGLAPSTIWARAVGDARFLDRITSGKGFTVKTYDSCLMWFSENWLPGMAWPSEIVRPECHHMEKTP